MLEVTFPRAQSVTGGSQLLGILPKSEVHRRLEFGHVPDCGEERVGDEDGERRGRDMRGEKGVGLWGCENRPGASWILGPWSQVERVLQRLHLGLTVKVTGVRESAEAPRFSSRVWGSLCPHTTRILGCQRRCWHPSGQVHHEWTFLPVPLPAWCPEVTVGFGGRCTDSTELQGRGPSPVALGSHMVPPPGGLATPDSHGSAPTPGSQEPGLQVYGVLSCPSIWHGGRGDDTEKGPGHMS